MHKSFLVIYDFFSAVPIYYANNLTWLLTAPTDYLTWTDSKKFVDFIKYNLNTYSWQKKLCTGCPKKHLLHFLEIFLAFAILASEEPFTASIKFKKVAWWFYGYVMSP